MQKLLIFLSLLAFVVPVTADGNEPAALWVQGQALFYDFRDLESRSHRERIRILEQAETCTQRAHDRQAFRLCEQIEQADRQKLRAELREKRRQLRDQRDVLLGRL